MATASSFGDDTFSSFGAGGDGAPSSVDSEVGRTPGEYIEYLTNMYFPPETHETRTASSVQVVELKDGAYEPVEEFDELPPHKALEIFVNHRTFPQCIRNVNGNDCVVFSVKNPYTEPLNPRSWATCLYIAVPADCGATVAQFEKAREAWLAIQ